MCFLGMDEVFPKFKCRPFSVLSLFFLVVILATDSCHGDGGCVI